MENANRLFQFEERPSDSAFVEKVWRTQSERAGAFISLATSHWEMVIAQHQGKTYFTMRGPETKATIADSPPDTEFFGIVFKLGTFMPHLPARMFVDSGITLPEAAGRRVWLDSATWEIPDFDNADTFVDRLIQQGLIVREPLVDATLASPLKAVSKTVSVRQVQRRFLQATGLTHGAIRQIERARYAMTLLHQGISIQDAVEAAGYADQPHMTRSLKALVGQTPAQIVRINPPPQMSFLFNTTPAP